MTCTQEDALISMLPILERIPTDSLRSPSFRIETYFQEAEYLYRWCLDDRELLTAVGLNWRIVEDLPIRILAARQAQCDWYHAMQFQAETRRRWAEAFPHGVSLRKEILQFMRYGYRNSKEILSRIAGMTRSSRSARLIQDLNDLSVIGRMHLAPLLAVGFDETLLDEAARMSARLSFLHADAAVDKASVRAEKLTRDRAYTHLKNAVDTIREAGRFAFRKNPERARGCACTYYRRPRSSSNAAGAAHTGSRAVFKLSRSEAPRATQSQFEFCPCYLVSHSQR